MALPKTDAFTAANGTALETYDSGYVIATGSVAINTNAAFCDGINANSFGAAYWNGDSFNAAQSAIGTLAGAGSGGTYAGPGVRMSGDEGYYFVASTFSADSYFGSLTNGVPSDIGGTRGAFTAGDTIKMEVDSGFNFTLRKNGTSIATPSDVGSLYATGNAGLVFCVSDSSVRIDDATFDHVGGGATTRGMPFGTRSTAFNGGRTLTGIIR